MAKSGYLSSGKDTDCPVSIRFPELWHGTLEEDASDLRHIDSETGGVLEVVTMPEDVVVSGLESNGKDAFFCGGASSGKVRVVKRPSAKKSASTNSRCYGLTVNTT